MAVKDLPKPLQGRGCAQRGHEASVNEWLIDRPLNMRLSNKYVGQSLCLVGEFQLMYQHFLIRV